MEQLRFKPKEKEALLAFWKVYDRHRGEIAARMIADAPPAPGGAVVVAASTQLETGGTERELQRIALEEGDWDPYRKVLRERGVEYAKAGTAFSTWYHSLSKLRGIVIECTAKDFPNDGSQFMAVMLGLGTYLDCIRTEIAEAYLEAEHKLIVQQQRAIRELSTPVLQLREKLLLLPLVGVIDTQRAKQLTEGLLYAIRDRRAKAAVMDITGVPVVDSKVANHILLTVEAARLMGATVILTGMSPEIAQTLVLLGADLPNIITVSDLQEGIEVANRILTSGKFAQ